MQQDNNNIDKKLKQLENQALPDLSRMDEHWKNMQSMLQPEANLPKPKNGNPVKSFRWMIAAAFLGGLSFLGYKLLTNSTAGNEGESERTQTITTAPVTSPTITSPPDTVPFTIIIGPNKDSVILDRQVQRSFKTRTVATPVTNAFGDNIAGSLVTGDANDTADSTKPKPRSATLAEFFRALEQQPQQFVIDTRSDTIIGGMNGTALLIPANSFTTGGHVTITMKEYYTYEDIVSNKLTTCSGATQLVTGGMIHLVATVDGKEVDIQPGKSIRWFVPDTSAAISQMQLFSGETNGIVQPQTRSGRVVTVDTTPGNLDVVNWIPQEQFFTNTWLETMVKVLDLSDAPFRKKKTSRGEVGFFNMAEKPKISRDELIAMLKEKYGYYKVKVKKRKQETFFSRLIPGGRNKTYHLRDDVGDSAWVSADIAKRYKLTPTDTVTATRVGYRYVNGSYVKRSFTNVNLNALANRFSVDIRTMGWINCDKFYNDTRPKLNYYVELNDSAANYYTVLVFDNIRSMIPGTISGTKVIFNGIPRGESAKVICVGIHNGKTVAAMQPLPEYGTLITNLQFEETNPTAFKDGIAAMDQ